jgi:hypothetical protein
MSHVKTAFDSRGKMNCALVLVITTARASKGATEIEGALKQPKARIPIQKLIQRDFRNALPREAA